MSSDLPSGTPIPNESTVLFSFAPKNAYIRTAMLYKYVIPLQHKVKTRQLDFHTRMSTTVHLSINTWDILQTFTRTVTVLSIDEVKDWYRRAWAVHSSGVRGKKSLVPAASQLSAMDHDVSSKGSITPSVILDVTLPDDKDGSFYQGQVSVIFKDSIFQASNPFRHASEMQRNITGWSAS